MRLLDRMDFKLPPREENSHKGTFGKVLNISGSRFMPGAAFISSMAALKSGCGYVFLATDECVMSLGSWATSAIVFTHTASILENLKSSNSLLIGCGLGTDLRAVEIFKRTFSESLKIPVVIDADGLNLLAEYGIDNLPENLVLTPHPLEASRLLGGVEVEKILQDSVHWAGEISQRYNCVTVLKMHNTVVTSPYGEVYINTTGNSAMAKAGSGDVLAGIIASFLAQGVEIYTAATLAVYLHGLAGDIARDNLTAYCVLPNDLIDHLPLAFQRVM